jgi:demethylmenaquinone methyltransferase/2-methoxy-6-polyprenyl-1,4-benzoquinol methylase
MRATDPGQIAAKSQDPGFIRSVFGSIAPRYDFANHLLSGGMDFLWRRRAAKVVRRWQPRVILDLAAGSGDVALTLKKFCPESAIVCADFCHPMLLRAQRKGVENLVTADALRLPFADRTFDVVTVAFGLRNMESWAGALLEMKRVLRPGGHVLILDFSIPTNLLRAPYRFYLHRCLPVLAGFLTGKRDAYDYLARSIEAFPQGNEMAELIGASGFEAADYHPASGGIVSLYTGRVPA